MVLLDHMFRGGIKLDKNFDIGDCNGGLELFLPPFFS